MRIAQTQLRTSEAQALMAMIVLDLCFLMLNFIHAYTGYLPNTMFAVTQHQSYAELYQYAKIVGCIVILARAWLRGREAILLSFAFLFAYLLLVEALQIHTVLTTLTQHVLGMNPIDALTSRGAIELAWASCFIVTFMLIMLWQYRQSHDELKQDAVGLGLMVVILLCFTFLLDYLQAIIAPVTTQLFFLAAMVEDFGGMLATSLAVVGVHLVFVRTVRSQRHSTLVHSTRRRSNSDVTPA